MESEIEKYKLAKKKVLILKYEGDHSSASNSLATHDPNRMNNYEAIKCKDLMNLILLKNNEYVFNGQLFEQLENVDLKEIDLIAIDEVQFMENLLPFCNFMLALEKDVICTGLSGTFEKRPIGDILQLIPIASKVKHLKAYCMWEIAHGKPCMKDAPFTRKIGGDKNKIIEIGSIESEEKIYVPTCEEHFQ